PTDVLRAGSEAPWQRIRQAEPGERQALYLLHQEFKDVSMATLEVAVRPSHAEPSATWCAAKTPWPLATQAAA
ncbi:MAG: hypothetical protein CFE44_13050, partial [Burkholderiales bacterium PBB4]